MTDLSTAVQGVVTMFAERFVATSFDGLLAALRGRPKPTDGATEAERAAAAATFVRAVIDYRTTLSVLAGLRATLRGAVVTVPLLIRQINRLPQLSSGVIDAYIGLYMVGAADVLEAADAVLGELGRANGAFSEAGRRDRAEKVNRSLVVLDRAVAEFVAQVRADRRFKALPETAAQPARARA